MDVKFLLAFALCFTAALGQNSTGNNDPCSADNNNGFAGSECGNDKVKLCCHPARQVCLSGTPMGGDEQFMCSETRRLYGMRFVRVIIIPMCCYIFLVFLLIHMFREVKPLKPKPVICILCIVQTLLAALVVCSPMWKFALYAAFLSVVVFHMVRVRANKWALIVLITFQFFNAVAITGGIGTTNGVFIPLGFLAADNVPSWQYGVIDMISPGASCSGQYLNYFNLESVEMSDEGADPAVQFHGFCTHNWMATVGAAVSFMMVIQLVMLALSLPLFASQVAQAEGMLEKQEA